MYRNGGLLTAIYEYKTINCVSTTRPRLIASTEYWRRGVTQQKVVGVLFNEKRPRSTHAPTVTTIYTSRVEDIPATWSRWNFFLYTNDDDEDDDDDNDDTRGDDGGYDDGLGEVLKRLWATRPSWKAVLFSKERERERLSRCCSLCCDRKRRERKALTIKGHRMSERERDKRGKRSITLLFFSPLLRLWTSKKTFFFSSFFFSFSLPFFIFYYDEKVADARDYLTRISRDRVSGMEGNRHSPKRRRRWRVFHWGTCVWAVFSDPATNKIRPKRVFF